MAQYLDFYEFARAPFSPSADSEFLYWSPARQELCRTFVRAIAERKGLMMLTGAGGVGKTTLLHAVLEGAALQPLKVIFAPPDSSSLLGLFTTLVQKLEVTEQREKSALASSAPHHQSVHHTYSTRNELTTLLRNVSTLLMDEYTRGVNVVLIIDDAHAYSARSLLRLCHLTTLRVEEKALVQVVLVGRPALDLRVDNLRLWRLRRQLAVRRFVSPLTLHESRTYLQRRLAAVAYGKTPVLLLEGMALLAKHGHGIPRLLNMLGHDALTAGLVAAQRPIPIDVVRSVLPSYSQNSPQSTHFFRALPLMRKAAGMAIVIGGMTTLSLAGVSYLRSEPSSAILPSLAAKPVDVNSLEADTIPKETMGETAASQMVVVKEAGPPLPAPFGNTFAPQEPGQRAANPPTQSGATISSTGVPQEPRRKPVADVPPAPLTTVKTDMGSRSTNKQRQQQTQGKSTVTAKQPVAPPSRLVARTRIAAPPQARTSAVKPLTQKPKLSTPTTGEKVTKVAKPHAAKPHVAKTKVPPPPQQPTAVKRLSPPRKNPQHQRAGSLSPAKTSPQRTNNDRLFDE